VPPGEVHVPRPDAFLRVDKLTPGGRPARATLPLTNVTRGPVDVRLRARMATHDLDHAVRVELGAGDRMLASGTLGDLRQWTPPLRLERANERTVRVRAWIPAGTEHTAGRRVAVTLELDAELVKAARR
jgi:type IV pilus biogenesis protein CpaD/CtpE